MSITFDSQPSEGNAPPLDDYTLQVKRMGRAWIKGKDFNDPTKEKEFVEVEFKITEVPDEDLDEWLGFTFERRIARPRRLSDERGGLNKLIRAALNLPKIEDNDVFGPDDIEGKKFIATVGPNDAGYPQLDNMRPIRRSSRRSAPKVVEPEPEAEDEWPDEE